MCYWPSVYPTVACVAPHRLVYPLRSMCMCGTALVLLKTYFAETARPSTSRPRARGRAHTRARAPRARIPRIIQKILNNDDRCFGAAARGGARTHLPHSSRTNHRISFALWDGHLSCAAHTTPRMPQAAIMYSYRLAPLKTAPSDAETSADAETLRGGVPVGRGLPGRGARASAPRACELGRQRGAAASCAALSRAE